jgi:hypothetical protein
VFKVVGTAFGDGLVVITGGAMDDGGSSTNLSSMITTDPSGMPSSPTKDVKPFEFLFEINSSPVVFVGTGAGTTVAIKLKIKSVQSESL